jgi:hypothetical protein
MNPHLSAVSGCNSFTAGQDGLQWSNQVLQPRRVEGKHKISHNHASWHVVLALKSNPLCSARIQARSSIIAHGRVLEPADVFELVAGDEIRPVCCC